jgi:hypothetical protein
MDSFLGTHFTCFTSTKVQILTERDVIEGINSQLFRYSFYGLHEYKSTNTDGLHEYKSTNTDGLHEYKSANTDAYLDNAP